MDKKSSNAEGLSELPAWSSIATIDAVTNRIVGHRVHGHRSNVGVTTDDRLDRRSCEVLAVHPQPFVAAAGEVEPAVAISVGEVARPVPAVAEPGLGGFFILVVALEPAGGLGLDDLPDRLEQVGRPFRSRPPRREGILRRCPGS